MSSERRLRDALLDEAAAVDPDLERHLAAVRARAASRPVPIGRLTYAAVAMVITVVVSFGAVNGDPFAMIGSIASPVETLTPVASDVPADDRDRLAGTYTLRLHGGAIEPSRLAGDWQMTLGTDATLTFVAPEAFSAAEVPVTGYAYALVGSQLVTNALARHLGHDCTGSGTYRWELSGDRLTLERVDDMCATRAALLTAGAWSRTESGAGLGTR